MLCFHQLVPPIRQLHQSQLPSFLLSFPPSMCLPPQLPYLGPGLRQSIAAGANTPVQLRLRLKDQQRLRKKRMRSLVSLDHLLNHLQAQFASPVIKRGCVMRIHALPFAWLTLRAIFPAFGPPFLPHSLTKSSMMRYVTAFSLSPYSCEPSTHICVG